MRRSHEEGAANQWENGLFASQDHTLIYCICPEQLLMVDHDGLKGQGCAEVVWNQLLPIEVGEGVSGFVLDG